ncbi:aminotransferase class IV [Paenibacillus sp. P25]|nr:aminotransferase class IV [Paenibacillus sp. P25]
MGIRYTPDPAEVRGITADLLRTNGLQDAYFRFTVSAGPGLLGLPAGEYESPQVIMYVKALPAPDPRLDAEGRPLQPLRLRRNTPEGEVRLKSLHYMNNILAKREPQGYASAALGAEGLLLDRQGRVSEGIVSNVFFIRGDRLGTPSLETGILPGITRRFVMELVAEAGLAVEEGLYLWGHLEEADEVFLTNSVQEIVPVTSLFNTEGGLRRVGSGIAGVKTAELRSLYCKVAYESSGGDKKL